MGDIIKKLSRDSYVYGPKGKERNLTNNSTTSLKQKNLLQFSSSFAPHNIFMTTLIKKKKKEKKVEA